MVDGWTYWHYPFNVIGKPTTVPEVLLSEDDVLGIVRDAFTSGLDRAR